MNAHQCLKLAREASKAAGFAHLSDIHHHVIGRGYRAGDDRAAFNRAQAVFHHIVQPLRWAVHERGEDRARWVRCAHKGALMIWLTYAPAVQS